MGFLKKLFGGGQSRSSDADGLYFYVRAKRTNEVIALRINRANDLSITDDQNGYYVRKIAVGQRSFDRIECEFWFDKDRHFVSAEIAGGELVDREDYDDFVAAQSSDDAGGTG